MLWAKAITNVQQQAIKKIVAAEADGIRQIWMNQGYLDTLTIFAAAATKTSAVRLGTAIVQTYPRHPLALAQQVLVLNDIAPGRLRLGIGPSHSSIIEGIFGLSHRKPLGTFTRICGSFACCIMGRKCQSPRRVL